jgi:tetratricopeptide (TPR) repeat protein
VRCPKCSFEVVDPGGGQPESCPKCGVVFRKLGKDRPARPIVAPASPRVSPPAPSGGGGVSLFNIAILSFCLSVSVFLAWKWYGPGAPSESAAAAPASHFDKTNDGAPVEPGEAPEVRDDAPVAQPETLVLPGFEAPAPVVEVPAPPKQMPRLPKLDESSANLPLLERAKQLALEYPGESYYRDYVVNVHFILAVRELRARKYRGALDWLEASEDWGAPPGEVASFRAAVYDKQESWDLAEKWARTALAYGAKANPAEMHHIIGKAYYFREDLPEAIEEFRKALAIREDAEIRASLEMALRDARAAEGFDKQRLSHFIVRYEGDSMEDTGRLVLDQMERSYASLLSQLGFEPDEPVVVLLYSRTSYREMGGPHWSAGYFDGKIRVPVRGLQSLDSHIRSTLHHELAHAFIHDRAGNAAPRWLHEGIAEYVEGTRASETGKELAKILNQGQSFEHCLPTARCDVRIFYAASTSIVDYMIQMKGMGGIRDLLIDLGDGGNIDSSLRKVLGKDQMGLIRDWEHFVKRRYS